MRMALAFAGLAMAASLCLSLLLGWRELGAARETVGRELTDLARRLQRQLDDDMARRVAQVDFLSQLDVFAPRGDAAAATATLNRLQAAFPTYVWAGVADPSGRLTAATNGMLVGADVSARPWFRAGIEAPFVGDVHEAKLLAGLLPDRGDPWRFVDVATPLHDRDGAVTGVLGVHLDWRWVSTVERSISTPHHDRVGVNLMVVGQDGEVLMGPDGLLGRPLPLPGALGLAPGASGVSVETWPDGVSYLVAAVASDGVGTYRGLGWTVLARQPVATADAPAWATFRTTLWWGLVTAALLAGMGAMLARLVTAPLARIAGSADLLRSGAAVELPALRGPREIEVLSGALRSLVAALTSKEAALDAATAAARRDPLTGLLNRAGLRAYLEGAALRAGFGGRRFAALCLDLDGFKAVNDTHGHAAGDVLLVEVARRVQQCVRGGDAVARIGGDEFVVVIEDVGDTKLMVAEVSRRMLGAIEGAPVEVAGTEGRAVPVRVGCSIGGALWPSDGGTLPEVILRADEALYAAKRAGKHRVVMSSDAAAA